MLSDETKPSEFKNIRGGDHSHIKGWGIDADPKNDPTYPMKKRTDEEIEGYTWERPPQQPVEIEVLRSVERPNITSVFGTAMPPKGLSGVIRRLAFKKSESSFGRWVPLILADRIGVVEGYLEDFSRGYIPNVFKERGWTAEWKYNRKNFLIKTATVVAVTAAGALILSSSSKKRKKKNTERKRLAGKKRILIREDIV